jgi:hypothetical protein
MRHLVDGVRHAVAGRSWYAALGMALALPDICGYAETPKSRSGDRYSRWFTANVQPLYTQPPPPWSEGGTPLVSLSGDDCYALRCAFLHQGAVDITAQAARDVLDRFVFVVTPPNVSMHYSTTFHGERGEHRRLLLQVDLFCEDICGAVDAWIAALTDPDVRARIAALPTIIDYTTGSV